MEEILGANRVTVLARLPDRVNRVKSGASLATTTGDAGDIVAVREDNVLGTSFHPELTSDERIHVWWLNEVVQRQCSLREELA